jgi:transposase
VRRALSIVLSAAERETLAAWARSRTAPARRVTRARIVLAAAAGTENQQMAAELGLARGTVVTWRKRFADQRLPGIQHERPGRGRPATARWHWAKTIVKVTLETTPPGATHGSLRTLAAHLGVSPALVTRVWREHKLQPHRTKTFNPPRRTAAIRSSSKS